MALLTQAELLRRIRIWLVLFIAGLALSGITAFPLAHELKWLNQIFAVSPTPPPGPEPALHIWLRRVNEGVEQTGRQFPFMAYGTDWLAFAHLVIAIAFIGPLRDPVRNRWVLIWGLIACAGVLFLAFIAGPIRGIPFYWRLIDSSFGVLGCIPLLICLRYTHQLECARPWTLDPRP